MTYYELRFITFHNFNKITVDLTSSNEKTAFMQAYFYSVDRSRNFTSKQQENKQCCYFKYQGYLTVHSYNHMLHLNV